MDKLEKTIFIGLFAAAAVLTVLLFSGADGLLKPPHTADPFPLDRVVPVKIVMAEKDWQWLLANARAKKYVRADFWFDGRRFANVAVRPKGNSSLMSVAGSGSKRLSLKVDFNFFNSAQNFYGLKKIGLNNGFADPTFIREVLAYEIFQKMGMPTPRTCFVDVYVNNLHLGLYTQVEVIDRTFLARHFPDSRGNLYKPEIGAALLNWTQEDVQKQTQETAVSAKENPAAEPLAIRLGGRRLSDLLELLQRESGQISQQAAAEGPFGGPGGFGPPPDGGFPPDPNRFGPLPDGGGFPFGPPPFAAGAPDGRMPDPNGLRMPFRPGQRRPGGFGGPPGLGRPGFRGGNLLEAVGLKTNENNPDHTALFRLLDVLNKCPDETFPQEIEKVLDVDQVLRFLAVSVMLVHLDNYIGMGHNYYLYEMNGRFTILPWDLNMAFGTFRMGFFQQDIADFYIDEPVTDSLESRPLVRRLLAHPAYLQRYHQYLQELLDGPFAEGQIESRIDQLAALVRPYVEKDELKFFTLDDFEKGLNEGSSDAGWMRSPAPDSRNQMNNPQQGQGEARQGRPGRFGFGRRGPGGPGGPGGMGAPGLKSFIVKRRLSVQRQLSGEIPSKPTEQQRQQSTGRFPWMPPAREEENQ
ncbi:MAG TPA: CotH kinase family protein [Anaerohalosphaeraceae bacterium]|nr:CotH kinase family protein [Anaerohalosphaeraceae bacterium]HPB92665.1 CotH kinase family protein [Anaerohalosphaeraceae bacterium]HRT23052.1 CotH kinase family protein [Anaerohalosphaeraceae bacterium]